MNVGRMGMNVVQVGDKTEYNVYCPKPDCGFVFESFSDTHLCPYFNEVIDIDGNIIKEE